MTGALLLAVVLLAANAYFVAAEFALVSTRRDQVEPAAEEGVRRARSVLNAMERLSTMLAGCQLGVTVASLGLGAVAEPALAHLLARPLEAMGLPHGAVHPTAFVLSLVVVVFCHMVLGEMVPKNIAMAGPDRAALWLVPPLVVITRVTAPVLWLLGRVANGCLRLARIEPVEEVRSVYTAEELPAVLAESREHELLDPSEHRRLSGALALQSRPAASVMRPWREVVTVTGPVHAQALERTSVRTGLSRFPVVVDGRVRGYVHVLDALAPAADGTVPVHPLVTVPPAAPLSTLLARMRAGRTHLALVRGADGVVQGLTSLDDVLTGVLA